ncbi:MAG: hypothetical protein WDM71_08610 [Ferruginibacter sp.]
MPGYLSLIKDGIGLNVLLRNYWMVIHPPILFLGFASTIVPFAYAYAGIQTKRFGELGETRTAIRFIQCMRIRCWYNDGCKMGV